MGDRTADTCAAFLKDLATRLTRRVQFTTDGYRAYLEPMDREFGRKRAAFGMLAKVYGLGKTEAEKEALGQDFVLADSPETVKQAVWGNPDEAHISTSIIERHNLSMRMQMRRMTRKTNSFSRKYENHVASVALYFFHYNFIKPHAALNDATPAMACGVSPGYWTVPDLVTLVEAAEPPPGPRGPYRKARRRKRPRRQAPRSRTTPAAENGGP